MTAAAPIHPFKIANFRYYWLTRLTSMLGLYAMMLIIGWQTYNIARETMDIAASSARLGLMGLLEFLPLFVLTPFVGWVADRLDRRWIARVSFLVQTGIAITLAILTYHDQMTLNVLYVIALFLGVVRAFAGPALGALAPNLVPRESLPTAIAISTIAWQAGILVGPAMAGPLYVLHPALPYAVAAALYATAFIALMMVGKVPVPKQQNTLSPLGQIAEGMAYVWQNKLVFGVITLDLFAVFLAGSTALLPVFARDILQVGEQGLSLLAASPALGAIVTAAIFSFRPIKTNVGNKMLASVFVFGLVTVIFGLSPWLWLSMACLVVAGAADMFSVYVRQSLIQLNTPDEKRGRVSAVSLLTISASNQLGDGFSGFLAYFIGPVAAVVSGGVGAIAITALWAKLFPQIGAARSFDDDTEQGNAKQVNPEQGDKAKETA